MWYAAQVRSNFEALVTSTLQERKLESFYPYSERKGYRDKIVRSPYFPGYVFVESDLSSNAARRRVIEVPQVLRIVGTGTEPEAIPEREIFSVRKVAQFAAELARQVEIIPTAAYKSGDRVIIRKGPLQGIEGYIAFVKDKIRLVVQVEMLGQAVSAEVDAEWLEKAIAA